MFGRKPDDLDEIGALPIFHGLSRGDLRRVLTLTTTCRYRPGARLCREGSAGQEAMILLLGRAEVSSSVAGVLAVVGAGDVVGEVALLARVPRTATVTALTEVEALVMDPRQFASLMTSFPTIGRAITAELARRFAGRRALPPGRLQPAPAVH